MKGITLLYDEMMSKEVKEEIVSLFQQHLRIIIAYRIDLKIEIGEDDFIVTYLSDEVLKELLPKVSKRNWKIAFLPHPEMIHARSAFGVSDSLEEAVQHILAAETTEKVDMLLANGRPVFDTVVIGECLSVMYGSSEPTQIKRKWGKLKNFFTLFKRVSLQQYTLEYTGKESGEKKVINTAAMGMLVVQHGESSLLSRRIIENSFVNDGMMHSLILAPESVAGLVHFGISGLLRSDSNPRLPPFASHIKTDKLRVCSSTPIELSVDDALMSAKEVELEVVPNTLNIVPGLRLKTRKKAEKNELEVFKIHSLPKGKKRDELLKGPLPLINHATKEEFKDLFTTLRQNAKTTSSYLVLTFLSVLIATLGLFSNSSPVIIGAMILAPLMNPIISFSMGVLRQDNQLIKDSLKTIGYGLLIGYICALGISWITPLSSENIEILSRTRPNLLDLGIAVGSGIAGAYAHSKKEIAKTLAGVAIAVALVPPLAVSGIGLGRMNWNIFSGALLLLTTNFAGMILAAALTFLFLGFSPFRLAKKGLVIALALVIGVSAPLAFGFSRMVKENDIIQNLDGFQVKDVVLREVRVRQTDPLRISVKIISEKPLTQGELKEVKNEIEDLLDEEVELEVSIGLKI